jgi:hypothetical protein
VGIRFTFCIAQKVTKTLVAQKTRLFGSSIAWFPYLLARLFAFHVLFLEIDLTHVSCHSLKQIFLAAQTVLSDRKVPIRGDYDRAARRVLSDREVPIRSGF